MSKILGISAFYHDSSACLIIDGEIISAVQEERFTRIKHDASFPKNAIQFILDEYSIDVNDIEFVSFYEKPLLKFERLIETYIENAPSGFQSFRKAMPLWIKDKLFQKQSILKSLKEISADFSEEMILFSEHHLSHAASAFYPSPYEKSLILTIDGVGEWATTSVAIGDGNKISLVKEINYPHSLGLLYSAFTYYLGFKVNGGEYKVMGLAPYGEPKYKDIILEKLVDFKDDGSFGLDQSFFNYSTGLTMVNQKFCDLFSNEVRRQESDLNQFHMNIASSVQAVTEEILIRLVSKLYEDYKIDNICLAGGVALNCVANSKLLLSKKFKNIWIQPAAGDAGGSLGAALITWYSHLGNQRIVTKNDSMKGSYLGPVYQQALIEKELFEVGANFDSISKDEIIAQTSQALADGLAVGWFQGRMEFGPRALGNRSILADPRSDKMQKILNLKVKFRESFRPFAPSVLREDVRDWFEFDYDSPYMLLVGDISKDKRIKMTKEEESLFGIDKLNIRRSSIPAVTHVDYSARIQTVNKETNSTYHDLLSRFKEKTGCPVLVNTSFNVRGEPIVCTPTDAFKCFMGTELDLLVVGNCILKKGLQEQSLKEDYKDKYELD